jgi:hypothetical protein
MVQEDERPPNHPWKRRGEDERVGAHGRYQEDRDHRAKRQHGMGVQSHGGGKGEEHRGNFGNQEGWQGRRQEDFIGGIRMGQDMPCHGGGGDPRNYQNREMET